MKLTEKINFCNTDMSFYHSRGLPKYCLERPINRKLCPHQKSPLLYGSIPFPSVLQFVIAGSAFITSPFGTPPLHRARFAKKIGIAGTLSWASASFQQIKLAAASGLHLVLCAPLMHFLAGQEMIHAYRDGQKDGPKVLLARSRSERMGKHATQKGEKGCTRLFFVQVSTNVSFRTCVSPQDVWVTWAFTLEVLFSQFCYTKYWARK